MTASTTSWLEIVETDLGVAVIWASACACCRRRLLWRGERLPEAYVVAREWADAIGGDIQVIERGALH